MANSVVSIDLGTVTPTCFIAMPFSQDFVAEYEQVIKPAVEAAGMVCVRGDELYSNRGIVDDVWRALRACRLVIAELSGRNANVLYETGLAHAIGKPVILLTRNERDVPFDLKSLRYVFYRMKDPFWGQALRAEIQRMIAAVVSESDVSPHLEGIRVSPHGAGRPVPTEDDDGYGGVLDESAWSAEWGMNENRHTATLMIRQREMRLFGTLAITHEHDGVVTVVHETLIGRMKNQKVELTGTAYTFVVQGNCPGYRLDEFVLHLSEDARALEGTIPQRAGDRRTLSHQVKFVRTAPQEE